MALLDAAVETDAGASKGKEEVDLKQLEEEVLATETNEGKVEWFMTMYGFRKSRFIKNISIIIIKDFYLFFHL